MEADGVFTSLSYQDTIYPYEINIRLVTAAFEDFFCIDDNSLKSCSVVQKFRTALNIA